MAEDQDEVDEFAATIDPNTLKNEELSERWRARVREDERRKLQQRQQQNWANMTDSEFARATAQLFSKADRLKAKQEADRQQRIREAVSREKMALAEQQRRDE
jgi:hypothetical protein